MNCDRIRTGGVANVMDRIQFGSVYFRTLQDTIGQIACMELYAFWILEWETSGFSMEY